MATSASAPAASDSGGAESSGEAGSEPRLQVAPPPLGTVAREAARRRTFAVISHPDAGKSTLTEALAHHARAISSAGAVHGKAGRRGTVSDWTDLERERGISITSAALQFPYGEGDREVVINLVDTPGHADFSEDTYRVLTAVDCAVMLIDAAKGMEPQTMRLYQVCRGRGIPVIVFVNKWDRPGRDALELLDELAARTDLRPAPLTWPVGIAGDFRGVLDRATGELVRPGTAGDVGRAAATVRRSAGEAAREEGEPWATAVEEVALLEADGAIFDGEAFRAGRCAPVLFGAAVDGAGVPDLLETLVTLAPAPGPRLAADGVPRPLDAPFSGVVFKVQAGMDTAHRDRLAFVRVCSGRFERGTVVIHASTGRPFATKYAQGVFGRERHTVDEAFPGDVVGLVNASALRVGDTLYAADPGAAPVTFPPLPRFAPEHFAVLRACDAGRYKQFRRGVSQLEQEGVVQVLHSDRRGEATPVVAAVGPMQFEVAAHRMEHEFSAPTRLDLLPYTLARLTRADDVALLDRQPGVEVLTRTDGALLALFPDRWRIGHVQREFPDVVLDPLPATTE